MVINRITRNSALLLGGVLLLALIPIAFRGNSYILNILAASLMWGVIASAWDLCIGYARIWSFGHIAFFVTGGYTGAMSVIYLGIPPAAAILLGGLLAAAVGVLIALPCLKLTGIYIAMVTFGVHLVLSTFILWGRDYTYGATGLASFTRLQLGQFIFSSQAPFASYYVIFGISILMLYIIYRIIKSPIGLAFMALRDSPSFALSNGVNDYKYKIIVFAISAFIAGLMGAVYTFFFGTISPFLLEVSTFLLVLMMLMLGGLGTFPGAVIGAFVITGLSEALRPLLLMRYVILGAVVIGVMIAMPRGLMALPDYIRTMIRRSKKEVRTGEYR